jgi:hypothetical protein
VSAWPVGVDSAVFVALGWCTVCFGGCRPCHSSIAISGKLVSVY